MYSEFGIAFRDAYERIEAKVNHSYFDTNILEIDANEIDNFVDVLQLMLAE
jgi:hypothetical protein